MWPEKEKAKGNWGGVKRFLADFAPIVIGINECHSQSKRVSKTLDSCKIRRIDQVKF